MQLFSIGAVSLTLIGFAALVWFRNGRRSVGIHNPANMKGVTESPDRAEAVKRFETGRVVRSHRVLSGKLMDSPTGRIVPSERHRVPPWVESSRHGSTRPNS